MQSINILDILCSEAGWFDNDLVTSPEDRRSRIEDHIAKI